LSVLSVCPDCLCVTVTLVYCGQTVGWIKIPLGTEVGLDPGDTVLDGDPARLPNGKGHSSPPLPRFTDACIYRNLCLAPPTHTERGTAAPHFPAYVYCGQTVGWIRISLGTKVGLGPGDTVLDGDAAPLPQGKGHSSPTFGPCLLWPNGRQSQQLLSSC